MSLRERKWLELGMIEPCLPSPAERPLFPIHAVVARHPFVIFAVV
jgi:hypothetical protein